ncbi:MAG: cation:proton antiporter [Candidatus Altiarchaeota archaeon]
MADISLFWDVGLVIVTATVLAYVARLLRQPILMAYMIAGILIGPMGYGLISEPETIKILSEFGIAFLLFIVGLELDLRRLKDLGLAATSTAFAKSILLFAVGFLVAQNIGYSNMEAIYIGLTLALSSTMIVIKLLSDKGELDTLHGRVVLGILLTEDVIAIMALSILSGQDGFTGSMIAASILKGLGLFFIAFFLSRFVLPSILRFVAKSTEMLFLTALSLCFLFSFLADMSGFSIAIGSFIAGISVATFPYNIEIVSRLRSLRDFFVTIFFVSLGMEIWVSDISRIILPLVVFVAIIIALKPIIIMAITSLYGYGRRTSFLTSISLTQISEFSLIIAIQGVALGHISPEIFSLIALMAVITFTLTSYMIEFDNSIYKLVSKALVPFERLSMRELVLEDVPIKHTKHAVVCGCHRMGYSIVKMLRKEKKPTLVIDFNPDIVRKLIDEGYHTIYGDIGDMEIINRMGLPDAEMIISTIPDQEDNLLLVKEAKSRNPDALVFVNAETLNHALELYNIGADYVIFPRMVAGEKVSDIIDDVARSPEHLSKTKLEHIKNLESLFEEELLEKYSPSFLKSIEKKFDGRRRK